MIDRTPLIDSTVGRLGRVWHCYTCVGCRSINRSAVVLIKRVMHCPRCGRVTAHEIPAVPAAEAR
jgi:hypothetical protein